MNTKEYVVIDSANRVHHSGTFDVCRTFMKNSKLPFCEMVPIAIYRNSYKIDSTNIRIYQRTDTNTLFGIQDQDESIVYDPSTKEKLYIVDDWKELED